MRQRPSFTAPICIVLVALSVLLISILTVQTDNPALAFQPKYLALESQDDGPDGDEMTHCPVIDYRPLLGIFDAQFLSHIISKGEGRLSSAEPILSSHLYRAPPA